VDDNNGTAFPATDLATGSAANFSSDFAHSEAIGTYDVNSFGPVATASCFEDQTERVRVELVYVLGYNGRRSG